MRFKRTLLLTVVISMAMTGTAFAGTWRAGAAPNQNKWWYEFDNGTYASNGWQWIDGDNNGIAECYYFDAEGWMLAGTTTPDGYTVNESGAWTVNGVVQTKAVETPANGTPSETQASQEYSGYNNSSTSEKEEWRYLTEEEYKAFLEERSQSRIQ